MRTESFDLYADPAPGASVPGSGSATAPAPGIDLGPIFDPYGVTDMPKYFGARDEKYSDKEADGIPAQPQAPAAPAAPAAAPALKAAAVPAVLFIGLALAAFAWIRK